MMNNKLLYAASFMAGAAIGSVITWRVLQTKYNQIIKEEIESVKDAFTSKTEEEVLEDVEKEFETTVATPTPIISPKPSLEEYKEIVKGYTDYSSISDSEEDEDDNEYFEYEEIDLFAAPYVISPEEFGENEDYDTISLRYYADSYLVDDMDELVEDVDNVVGDFANHFGEYEDDSVHIRNDNRKCDYEILKDQRKYLDIVRSNPHQMED